MFSHIVIFWTYPDRPSAPDELIAGARFYLGQIPGIVSFHVGKMTPSHRAIVEQSYQVGLNIQFESKELQDAYQDHPLHVEFVEKIFRTTCHRAVVYDFE